MTDKELDIAVNKMLEESAAETKNLWQGIVDGAVKAAIEIIKKQKEVNQ